MPTPSLLLIKYSYLLSYGSFAYKYSLSMSGWFSIKFNNTFVFPVPEPPIINILYGWSGIYGQFLLCLVLFSLTISSKFIIYTLQRILLSISLSHTLKAFVPYGYVVTLSNVCSLLLSLLFSAILFTSSVYTLWWSLSNLSCDRIIVLLLNNESL